MAKTVPWLNRSRVYGRSCGRGRGWGRKGNANKSSPGGPADSDSLTEGRRTGPNFANISASNKSVQTSDRFLFSASGMLAKSRWRRVNFCFHSPAANVSE